MAPVVAAQQPGTITGTVTNVVTGEPVAGAQVLVVDTERGALTNAAGRFLIVAVPAGTHTVRVQMMGYAAAQQTVTVPPDGTAEVNFEIREEAIPLDALVVTALGIQREERGLGYAVQSVGEEILSRTPEVNLVQALQGRTAGVQIVQASGRPGASSRINIRGQSTFTGSGQPLFIIDGIPVSTDLDNEGMGPLGTGSAGNRAMDFDMSNVAEVSVLRGAAATALYGSRAAAGVVLIRTRSGTVGAPLRWEFSSSMGFAEPIIKGYVEDWAAGLDRMYCDGRMEVEGGYCQPGFPTGTGFPAAALGHFNYPGWGPHKDSIPAEVRAAVGDIRFEDARKQYYQRAPSFENSIRAMGGLGEQGAFTLGLSYLDQGDIRPTGKLERLNMSLNVDLGLGEYLRSNTSLQRIATHNPFPAEAWTSDHHRLLFTPPNVDIRNAWNPDGSPMMWGPNHPHPIWQVQNEYMESNVDRWILSQRLAFDLPGGLTLSNTFGMDSYLDDRRQHQNERPWRTAEGLPSGGTRQEKINRTQINNDLVLSLAGTTLGETGLTVNGLVGGNIWMTERSRVAGTGATIIIPGYYNLANFETQRVFGDLTQEQRLVGAYGQATVDYRDWAYLTLTGRNDWSSTLPNHANRYFYPSAALGLVFTEALDWRSDWMPYGKLRLSYAKVGSDAPPYSLASTYGTAFAPGAGLGHYQFTPTNISFPFRGQVGFLQSTSLGNPDIRPESTREYEVGLELRLLQNRARLDVSYYDKKSFDQIFRVPASAASGYTSIVRNAGDLRNEGWEVSFQARPIETRDFSWDLLANWTRNRNSVLELAPGIDNIHLAGYSWPSIRIMEGQPYGVIWGYAYQRNCDERTSSVCFPDQPVGALLIGGEGCLNERGLPCDGLPLRSEHQLAITDAMPNWLANLSTQLRYRSFGASTMWDVRNGSKILNFELQYTTGRNGRHIWTNDRYSETMVEGINVDTGQPNTQVVIKDPNYYELMYGYDRHEGQIEDGGFIKLREVTLFWDVPASLLSHINVDRARLYVTGRNLAVWSDFSMGDPEADIYGGATGAGQFFRQFPGMQTRGVTLGMRASF